jgi:RNA polymerase primary sigma factor
MNKLALLKDISKASRRLSQAQDREPDIEAIAAEMNMSPKEIVEVLEDVSPISSLDEPLSKNNERTVLDFLPDEAGVPQDIAVLDSSVIEELMAGLTILDDREQKILRLYYGLDGEKPMTLEAIGAEMGITRERVRQLRERALAKLRDPKCSRLREVS